MTIPVRFGNVEKFKFCQSVWRLAHHLATLHQLTAPVVQQPPINQLTGRAIGDFTWANRSSPLPGQRATETLWSFIFHISRRLNWFVSINELNGRRRVATGRRGQSSCCVLLTSIALNWLIQRSKVEVNFPVVCQLNGLVRIMKESLKRSARIQLNWHPAAPKSSQKDTNQLFEMNQPIRNWMNGWIPTTWCDLSLNLAVTN